MGMEVDAANFRESRRVAKDKMLKMCIFRIGKRHMISRRQLITRASKKLFTKPVTTQ